MGQLALLWSRLRMTAAGVGSDVRAARAREPFPTGAVDAAGFHGDVLLVHGWLGRPDDLSPLAADLLAAGFAVHSVSYDASVHPPDGVDLVVRRMGELPGPVHLVGHSLGGLLAVAAAAVVPERVASVTAVASPLKGTQVASVPGAHLVGMAHLRPGSGFVTGLQGVLTGGRVPVLTIAAEADVVAPPVSSAPAGTTATAVVVPRAGHFDVVSRPETRRQVLRFITGS